MAAITTANYLGVRRIFPVLTYQACLRYRQRMAVLASCLVAAMPLMLGYLYYQLRWWRFKQFAHFPQPSTSFIWGNMLTVHEQIQSGGVVGSPDRQIGMEQHQHSNGA